MSIIRGRQVILHVFLGLPAWVAAGVLYLVMSKAAQNTATVERARL